jgi:hypothetical protein
VAGFKERFPSENMRERAHVTSLVERGRKLDAVAMFFTLSFGFAAGSDRSLQAFLERYCGFNRDLLDIAGGV